MNAEVLIVGAGMTGASAAMCLLGAGFSVLLVDKSHAAGGRMRTRGGRSSGLQFDHGAQYFTHSDPRFSEFLQPWKASGVVRQWQPRLASIDAQGVHPKAPELPPARWVSAPCQDSLVKAMLAQQQILTGAQVAKIAYEPTEKRRWTAMDAAGQVLAQAEQLLLCLPAPQAEALLGGFPEALAFTQSATMLPSWALMLSFARAVPWPWDAAFVNQGPLRWVARDSSKPGRDHSVDNWVLHATPEWSEAHLETSAEQIARDLLCEFQRLTGCDFAPSHQLAHRWRYALGGRESAQCTHFYAPQHHLGIAGDWCVGGRVEGAFLSGLDLASELVRCAIQTPR